MRLGRLFAALAVLSTALAAVVSADAGIPLRTAIYLDGPQGSDARAYQRVSAAGARFVRLTLYWYEVAPVARPPRFRAADPADPAYRWAAFDAKVVNARANGLEPLVTVMAAPPWAQAPPAVEPLNSHRPSAVEFRRFALAVARRYSGTFNRLPRVRYWQAWNEPNLSIYLVPQLVRKRPVSPGMYRVLLNEFAAAVKSVNRSNVVVAGGLAPFRDNTPAVMAQNSDWGPLSFMRELLCLSTALKPKCTQRARFDVWATHPYTSGGPTRSAVLPNDVSLGDLPEMRAVLDAARRHGRILAARPVEFWVTEFSWDSSPPDPKGVPASLHARWVAEGLYRMWRNGVSLVTWLMLRDEPLRSSYLQSGLYYRGATPERDRPKPALQAFRFPVVGLREGSGFRVWGRRPAGVRVRVVVEQSFRGGWKRLALLSSDRHGIFQHRFSRAPVGYVRARLATTGEKSRPFSLRRVPDRFFNPFGQPGLLEPKP